MTELQFPRHTTPKASRTAGTPSGRSRGTSAATPARPGEPFSIVDAAGQRHRRAAHGRRAQQHHAGRPRSGARACRAGRRCGCRAPTTPRIATQAVLERRLAAEGKTRFDLGREEFEALFWRWKDEYEARILGALKRLGCSADWSRTRFTMDPGLSHAVRTVFVRLFDEGLIYRGARIINWCPKCTSAISDIEVNHEETEGELVTLRYPLKDGDGLDLRGDDARRDDARRHRRRREPGRRALQAPRRQDGDPPARRTRDPDRRRRRRRSDVRHGRGEGHARARRERLRDRASARVCPR